MWRRAWAAGVLFAAGCGSNLGKIDKPSEPVAVTPPPANFQKGLAPMPEGTPAKAPANAPPKPGGKTFGKPGKK